MVKKRSPWRLIFVSLVVVLAGCFVVGVFSPQDLSAAKSLEPQTEEVLPETATGRAVASRHLPLPGMNPYLIADIAEQVSPAVVFISVEWPPVQQYSHPFINDPFFRFFFGDMFPFPMQPGETTPRSAGTGFIIDEKGYILTNQHVVGDLGENQKIMVRITTPEYSGEVEAKLLGADYKLDLAVLQIEKPKELDKLPVVKLGDSDKSRPGEWVIAIGNPYGEQLEHTVTIGVLSAKGRQITIPDTEKRQYKVYENLMQTDAAINPGNSGGPLINIQGEVIGINTAVNAAAQGIGFAIPINTAKEVIQELIETGKVARETTPHPWLGVYYNEITEDIARYFNLQDTNGIIIVEVIPDSPAAKAGLRTYDVIRKIGEKSITGTEDFQKAIQELEPGEKVMFVVMRSGRRMLIPVEIGNRPEGY
ncbi:MAG: trypsin-like serine protease [Firmicutes bacterium]|nr:trypsin-like serine protease [Bacillota bacterium]